MGDEFKARLKELGICLIESPVVDVEVRKLSKEEKGQGGGGKDGSSMEEHSPPCSMRRKPSAISVVIRTVDGQEHEFSAA